MSLEVINGYFGGNYNSNYCTFWWGWNIQLHIPSIYDIQYCWQLPILERWQFWSILDDNTKWDEQVHFIFIDNPLCNIMNVNSYFSIKYISCCTSYENEEQILGGDALYLLLGWFSCWNFKENKKRRENILEMVMIWESSSLYFLMLGGDLIW